MSLMHLSCFIVSKNSCNLRVFRVNIFRPYNIFWQISYQSAQKSLWVQVWVAEPLETDICFLCIFQGIEMILQGICRSLRQYESHQLKRNVRTMQTTIRPRVHWEGVVILNQTSNTNNCRGQPMLIVKHHYCAQTQGQWTVEQHSALRRIRIWIYIYTIMHSCTFSFFLRF